MLFVVYNYELKNQICFQIEINARKRKLMDCLEKAISMIK